MPQPHTGPTLELLSDLRNVARYLERAADTAKSDDASATARSHAIVLWTAIDRVDELATLVNDLATVAGFAAMGTRES
jgi:phosphate uptake regulator